MKKTIILGLLLCSLFVTGCGCGKKEEKVIELKCISDINEYGEKNIVTAKFKENFLIDEKIETIIEFDDEILAQRYYDMYKDNERYETNLEGKTVSYYLKVQNESKDDIFEYNKFRDDLINNGYKCDAD